MKERKNEPGFLRKLGTVFLALLVTFSSVDRAVFAEGEESDSDIIQKTAEVQETADLAADSFKKLVRASVKKFGDILE